MLGRKDTAPVCGSSLVLGMPSLEEGGLVFEAPNEEEDV